jgi:hypothetical protein
MYSSKIAHPANPTNEAVAKKAAKAGLTSRTRSEFPRRPRMVVPRSTTAKALKTFPAHRFLGKFGTFCLIEIFDLDPGGHQPAN